MREVCRQRSESLARLLAAKAKCREEGILTRTFKMMDDDGEEEDEHEDEDEDEEVDVSGIVCADLARLWKERQRAVRACTKIGWTGEDREAKCGNLTMLKNRLRHIEESRCGEGGVRKWKEEVEMKERRCGSAGGVVQPPPSNPPRQS